MPSIFRPGLFDGHVAVVTGGGSWVIPDTPEVRLPPAITRLADR